ncbi:MAG TPA: hypothetical protein VEC96_16600 [Anaerolineae bacterium]|nr:hypothetical protein [Anaerolineae bacterium]
MSPQKITSPSPKASGAPPSSQLRSYGFTLARLMWLVLTGLILILFFAGIPDRFDQLASTVDKRSLFELGLSVNFYAVGLILLNLIFVLAHLIIAAVLFWRRADDWMALFVAFVLVTNGAITPLSLMYTSGSAPPVGLYAAMLVIYIGLVSGVTLLYLFPDGRFVPPGTNLLALTWAILILFAVFWPNSIFSLSTWPAWMQLLALLIWPGAGLLAQIYRYTHVSSPIQRQQTKWALLGLTAAMLGPLAYFLPFVILPSLSGPMIPNILYQRVGASFFTLSFLVRLSGLTLLTFILLLFPLSLAIAILRYHLWAIDILINRVLVYGTLTGTLGLVYLSSVILLQSAFRIMTGQDSQLAIIVSTLAIAALFNPLRRRLQILIDRRFYRHKYDAAQTLAAFSTTLRDEVDLDKLTTELLTVVEETMQPTHASLWLRQGTDHRLGDHKT